MKFLTLKNRMALLTILNTYLILLRKEDLEKLLEILECVGKHKIINHVRIVYINLNLILILLVL
jgi:hypothetical protein